jgi:hypothetical protein
MIFTNYKHIVNISCIINMLQKIVVSKQSLLKNLLTVCLLRSQMRNFMIILKEFKYSIYLVNITGFFDE